MTMMQLVMVSYDSLEKCIFWKITSTFLSKNDLYHVAAFDKDDPLYDETEENYILVSDSIAIDGYESTKFQDTKLYGPVYTQTEFKRRVSDICVEFYSTSMISDTILQLKELLESCQDYGCFIVKKCIEKSLDFSNRECELTSKLLVRLVHSDEGEDVTPPLLSSDEMEQGFELVLENLDELMIDCPEAPNGKSKIVS